MAKLALLVGVSEYQEGLSPLPSAVKDVQALQQVLQNPEIGGFDEVKVLSNPEPMAMQEAVESLFSSCTKEDLVLLFFSGHGVKDESGRLYFGTRSTRKNPRGDLVKATAVPASFIQDIMSHARCKRQVVILDCCFSGAFAEGMTAKSDEMVDVQAQLGGEGRAVLTSSTSTQYSFEQQDSDLSVYTQYIVEGMESGAADLDNDGSISINELHDYARKKVQETSPAMKPKIYIVEEGFKIRLAKARIGDPRLAYRKEVERRASRGEISSIGRRILDDLRESLALNPEEANAVEEEVLKPYRDYQKKLRRYEQAFAEAAELEMPISEATREELSRYQEILGLREDDILPIERKYSTLRRDVKTPSSVSNTQNQVKVDSQAPISDAPKNVVPQPQQNFQPQPLQSNLERSRVQPEPVQNLQTVNQPLISAVPQTHSSPKAASASETAGESRSIQTATNSGAPSWIFPSLVGGGIGLLILMSLIALPAFLNQATKAKQAEAKAYIGSINRGQQAFFLENSQFASDMEALELGIASETDNYSYTTSAQGSMAISSATPKQEGLKSYVGGAFVDPLADPSTAPIQAILCESIEPANGAPAPPTLVENIPQCAPGFQVVD